MHILKHLSLTVCKNATEEDHRSCTAMAVSTNATSERKANQCLPPQTPIDGPALYQLKLTCKNSCTYCCLSCDCTCTHNEGAEYLSGSLGQTKNVPIHHMLGSCDICTCSITIPSSCFSPGLCPPKSIVASHSKRTEVRSCNVGDTVAFVDCAYAKWLFKMGREHACALVHVVLLTQCCDMQYERRHAHAMVGGCHAC